MRQDRTAGFTLLELLVAVSVLGLLSVAIARGLSLGSDGWNRAHANTRQAGRLRDARRLLQQLVTAATPVFATQDLNDRTIAFAGDAQAMAMITRLPQSAGTPLMVAARLSVENHALVLDWRPDLPRSDTGGPLPNTRLVVAAHINAVRFAYFDPAQGWQTEWTGRTALPTLIRATMQDDDARQTLWPPLVMQTRATGTPACLYDSTDIECQRVQ
jgi:general secretion pathway protein J